MDEASAFTTLAGKDNAANVYGTLRSSANSRFPHLYWMGAVISFARRQEGDFTLARYEMSKTTPRMFGDLASTLREGNSVAASGSFEGKDRSAAPLS